MIRWGILSTARIAQRILVGARLSESAQIVAVGSRDLARAQAYASENGIARAPYGKPPERLVRGSGLASRRAEDESPAKRRGRQAT